MRFRCDQAGSGATKDTHTARSLKLVARSYGKFLTKTTLYCQLKFPKNNSIQMVTLTDLNSIANKWFDAFNDHDLEKLLLLYDENAQHYSPKLKLRQPQTNGLIRGKDALRAWWQDAFDRLPGLNYELIRLTPYTNRVFMEYVRHVKGEEDLYVGEMLEIENGKIVASSVFHR